MTSSPRPTTSRPSRFCSADRLVLAGLGLFLALMAAGLGMTDDEAYYWVLAQRPALGYAYHPPAVAWVIALSQLAFGWIAGANSAWVVRAPAVLSAIGMVALAVEWLRGLGCDERGRVRAILLFFSFAGMFGLCWMMVPDIPMLFGWMLLFLAVWKICFDASVSARWYGLIGASSALMMLSKISSVLAFASAAACLWYWAPKGRRGRAGGALVVGVLAALIPNLVWNARHDWGPILYQLRDRHEGFSPHLVRYLRFWVVEFLVAGPPLVVFAFLTARRGFSSGADRVYRFLALWIVPALFVFGVQPLGSDFKIHWAYVVWWPSALALAYAAFVQRQDQRWARFQLRYGLTLLAVVWFALQSPIVGRAIALATRKEPDPRWDVTNDLFGWNELPKHIPAGAPVVGAWYQTASQAAFALGSTSRVALVPRDLKARDEWPMLAEVDGSGPDWPTLREPVFFVSDNRYDGEPRFKDSTCEIVDRIESRRGQLLAKQIVIRKCAPSRRP